MTMKESITLPGWINSIYFRTIHVRYRVLNRGYIGNPGDRKIRAVLKAILQSQSPCLDQRHMVCSRCPQKESCIFFQLVVDQSEFMPYIVHVDDPTEWLGLAGPGKEQGFDIRVIGHKSRLADQIAEYLMRKPFFSFDAVGKERIRFELASVDHKHEGKEIRVKDLIKDYTKRCLWNGDEISRLRIEFVTPVEIRQSGKIISRPGDLTFDVFLKALYRRIGGLARAYCGFEGHIPSLEDLGVGDGLIRTNSDGIRFASLKPRTKDYRGKGKGPEYIGGFKGTLSFKGDLTPYLYLILLGEALHIGKKTTQGLGQYRIKGIS